MLSRRVLPIWIAASLLAVSFAPMTDDALATEPNSARAGKSTRVLPPGLEDDLAATFTALEPEWVLDTASVSGDRVVARFCPQEKGDCVGVQLGDPQTQCLGTPVGPWCVGFGHSPPPALFQERLEGALNGWRDREVWKEVGSPPEAEGLAGSQEDLPPVLPAPGGPPLWPALLALLTLLAPFGLALALSLLVARVWARPGKWWLRSGLMLVPLLPAVVAPLALFRVSAWDLLLTGLLMDGGLLLGWWGLRSGEARRKAALVLLGLLLGAALLEAGARMLPPPHSTVPEPESVSLFYELNEGVALRHDEEEKMLFPGTNRALLDERLALAKEAPSRVLHVGDSMVHGMMIPLTETFTARLDEQDPERSHINGGLPRTGPDFYALEAVHWLQATRAQRVVIYLFSGNDLHNLDFAYPVCRQDSLFRYPGQQAVPRCYEPEKELSYYDRLRLSPLPYALRVGASYLRSIHHLATVLAGAAGGWRQFDVALASTHLTAILRWLDESVMEQGARLDVVVLPDRAELENGPFPESFHQATLEAVREAGIDPLDAWSILHAAVQADGSVRWFVQEPLGDVHLNPAGHRLLANWLWENLFR